MRGLLARVAQIDGYTYRQGFESRRETHDLVLTSAIKREEVAVTAVAPATSSGTGTQVPIRAKTYSPLATGQQCDVIRCDEQLSNTFETIFEQIWHCLLSLSA